VVDSHHNGGDFITRTVTTNHYRKVWCHTHHWFQLFRWEAWQLTTLLNFNRCNTYSPALSMFTEVHSQLIHSPTTASYTHDKYSILREQNSMVLTVRTRGAHCLIRYEPSLGSRIPAQLPVWAKFGLSQHPCQSQIAILNTGGSTIELSALWRMNLQTKPSSKDALWETH